MNPKTVVILVLLLVLAGAAFLLTRSDTTSSMPVNQSQANAKAGDTPLLSDSELGRELNRITFDGGEDGTLLQLERIQGRWWVTTPSRFAANTKAVDELLNQLGTMTGRPANEDEPGGLLRDGMGLLLGCKDGETALYFSSRLGAGRAIITRITGDVYEDINTTDTLIDIFDSLDPDAFYANRFEPPLIPEVGRIEFKTAEANSILVQEVGRWWIETENGRERALEIGLPGYPGVNEYFELLKSVELIEKQSGHPANGMASFGLVDPLISVRFASLGTDHKEPTHGYEIHVGTPADPDDQARYISNGFAGQATHPVFTTETSVAIALGQEATAFRDPRLITTPKPLIESIVLKFGEGTTEWIEWPSNKPPVFNRFNSEQVQIPTEQASDLLNALTQTRALAYLPVNVDEWDEWISATIVPRLGGTRESITVYSDPMSSAEMPTMLVRREKEPVVLRVPKASVVGLLDPSTLIADEAE